MIHSWLLLAALHSSARADPATQYAQGLDALRDGSLSEAETHLLEALDQGAQDPSVYHALGNTYYRQQAHGRALASWERGLRLNPRAADLEANILHLRKELNLPLDTPRTTSRLPWNRWIAPWEGTLGSGLLLAAGLSISCLRRLRKKLQTKRWTALSVVCLILSAVLALSVWEAKSLSSGHIVVGEEVIVRSALGAQGVALFELTPGTTVTLIEENRSYALVSVSDGRRGWLPASSVLSCDPAEPFSPR